MIRRLSIRLHKFDGLVLIVLLIIYRMILDYSYINYISPNFSYSGMTNNLDLAKLFESYMILLILCILIPKNLRKASDFLLFILFIVLIIPITSYYALNAQERLFFYMMISGFIIVLITIQLLPNISPKKIRVGNLSIILLVGMNLLVMLWLIGNGGFSSFNLDFTRVYEFRRGKVINDISVGFWPYLNLWAYKVINPLLITLTLFKRKYSLTILCIFIQIIFFGISSHKSVFFFGVIPVAIFFSVRLKKPLHFTILCFCLLIGSIIAISVYLNDIFIISMLIRRTFYTPPFLNFAYYDIFSHIGCVHFSNMNIISNYLPYPFQYSPPRLVSCYLFGHPNTTCNTNFLATSYMQLGYVGVVIYSLITALLLWLVDILSRDMPKWFAISAVFAPFISLFTSADLFTSMVTHGILLSLLFLWLLGMTVKENIHGELS